MPDRILYLHGFLSSPASLKARQTQAYLAEHRPDITFVCPQLPSDPQSCITLLNRLIEQHQPPRLIGSSLGGFLSTYLVERFGGKAVLINPAVHPDKLMHDYLGEHTNPYTQECFSVSAQDADILASIKPPHLTQPENYWVLLQTGDETLDYQQAADKYAHSKLTIEQGGDHSFQGYQRHLPEIVRFLTN